MSKERLNKKLNQQKAQSIYKRLESLKLFVDIDAFLLILKVFQNKKKKIYMFKDYRLSSLTYNFLPTCVNIQ